MEHLQAIIQAAAIVAFTLPIPCAIWAVILGLRTEGQQ